MYACVEALPEWLSLVCWIREELARYPLHADTYIHRNMHYAVRVRSFLVLSMRVEIHGYTLTPNR